MSKSNISTEKKINLRAYKTSFDMFPLLNLYNRTVLGSSQAKSDKHYRKGLDSIVITYVELETMNRIVLLFYILL